MESEDENSQKSRGRDAAVLPEPKAREGVGGEQPQERQTLGQGCGPESLRGRPSEELYLLPGVRRNILAYVAATEDSDSPQREKLLDREGSCPLRSEEKGVREGYRGLGLTLYGESEDENMANMGA